MSSSTAILLITVCSFVLGFGRDVLIAVQFGGSIGSDILFVAMALPVFFENILGVALRDALIPFLKITQARKPNEYRQQVSKIGRNIFILSIVVLFALVAAPEFWIGLVAPGWTKDTLVETVAPFMIGAACLVVLVWGYFLTGLLNASGRLVVPMWRSVFFNIGAILALALLPGNPTWILLGMLAAQSIHLVWMQALVLRCRQDDLFLANLHPASERNATFMAFFLPILASTVALQVNVLAERFFASKLPEGSIACLSYAYRLTMVPIILFSFSVFTVLFPAIVSSHASGDFETLNRRIASGARVTLLVLLPFCTFLQVFSQPLVEFLFERGAFDSRATSVTAATVVAYAIGMPFIGLSLLGSRVLLAMEKGKQVAFVAALTMVFTVTADFLAYGPLGAVGLALAVSFGAVVQTGILWTIIYNQGKIRSFWTDLLRQVAAAGVCRLAFEFWPWRDTIGTCCAFIVMVSVFFISLRILGDRHVVRDVLSQFGVRLCNEAAG